MGVTPERGPASGHRAPAPSPVTLRSALIGLVLSVVHTAWVVYEETAWGHFGMSITATSLVASAVALLFLLLAFNTVVGARWPRLALSPTEMMVIFTMVTIAAVIAGFDLLQNLVPTLMMPFWYANPTNRWERFTPYIAPWLAPRDPAVVRGFFLGGIGFFAPTVWRAWLVPMAVWTAFLFVLSLTTYCINVLMRRQWVDRERLTFPILQVPLLMVQSRTIPALFSNRTLVIGFAIPVFVESLNVLSGIFPSLPGIQLNLWNIGHYITEPPLNSINPLYMMWQPFAIGLSFLIPLDISFSCWFFYLLRKAFEVTWVARGWGAASGGAGSAFPYVRELSYGAWVALFLTVMWGARDHLRSLMRMMLPWSRSRLCDTEEPLPYRLAALGATLGLASMVAFAIAAGMTPWVAGVYFIAYLLAVIVMTRIYAQVGMPTLELYYFNTESALVAATGSRNLGTNDLVVMTNFFWFNRCYRQHPMGHQIEALRFANLTGARMRPFSLLVPAATLVGIAVGFIATLHIYYSYGASSAKVLGYQIGVGWEAYGRLSAWTDAPQDPQSRALVASAASFGIAGGLGLLRNAVLGCPFHPIGYALAVSYALEYFWAPFLATWVVKLAIVRYGGLKAYLRAMPFFLGLVIGDFVTVIFWGLVASAFGIKGISPYLFHRW